MKPRFSNKGTINIISKDFKYIEGHLSWTTHLTKNIKVVSILEQCCTLHPDLGVPVFLGPGKLHGDIFPTLVTLERF